MSTALTVLVLLAFHVAPHLAAPTDEPTIDDPHLATINNEIMAIRQSIHLLAPNVNASYLQKSLLDLDDIIVTKLADYPSITFNNAQTLTQSVVITVNLIIDEVDFTGYSQRQLYTTLATILQVHRHYSLFLNDLFTRLPESRLEMTRYRHVLLATQRFTPEVDNLVVFQFEDIHLRVPLASLPNGASNLTATAVVAHSFAQHLHSDQLQVNSAIISLTVADYALNLPLNGYTLRFRVNNLDGSTSGAAKCAFWNPNDSTWSTEGCSLNRDDTSLSIFVCECTHLAGHFAVVKDYRVSPTVPSGTTISSTSTVTLPPTTTTSQSSKTTVNPTTTTTTMATTTITTTASPVADISHEIDNLLENLNTLPEIDQHDWLASLANLSSLVSTLLDGDMLPHINSTAASRLTNTSLAVVDYLIEADYIWANLTQDAVANSSSLILQTVGDLSTLMNSKALNATLFAFANIEMLSQIFQPNENITFTFAPVQLQLPIEALNSSEAVPATATLMKRFSRHLSSERIIVNSQFISLKIAHHQSITLNSSQRLQFVSRNLERLQFGDQALCTFWSFPQSNLSTFGCIANRFASNRSFTVCECNHLTDFAAVVDVSNREVPSLAKSILTYICSTISVFFLIWTVVMAVRYNREHYTVQEDQFNVKSNRYYLSLNIAVWLLVSHLLIMFGLDRTEVPLLCDLNSLLLLFTLLTTFAFMFAFSFHLYISTSRTHLFRAVPFRYFALFAYLFPLSIIIFSSVIIYAAETRSLIGLLDSLSGEYFCWLSSHQYPNRIWIFVGPVTLIILANSVLLFSILGTIIRNCRQKKTLSQRLCGNLLTAYILCFNFGVPWLLFLFYINEQMAHIFSYVFILVNGTQGVALFAEQYLLYRLKRQRFIMRNSSDSSRTTFLSSSRMSR